VTEAERLKALEQEVLKRLDPNGEMGEMLNTFAPLIDSRVGRGFLRLFKLVGVDLMQLRGPIDQARTLLSDMASAIVVFTPLGWAPSSRAPTDVYADALEVYRHTSSGEEAEQRLVAGWNETDRLRYRILPVRGLGMGHDPLHDKFLQRSRLVEKALNHHNNGAYEAAVPIVLAQVDGIVSDLTDPPRDFFGKQRKATHLVDTTTIAGLPQGLQPLRLLFSEDMKETGATGMLSRHGILHGRELGYDTKINSTKAFVLLLAIIEWAQPRARARVEYLEREREERYAGSEETDEEGRRLDRRGFQEARESLRWLATVQSVWFQREGVYSADLDELQPGDLGDSALRGKASITLIRSADRREFWAWRKTIPAFYFGVAGRDGDEWLYAGPNRPQGGLGSGLDWRPADGPWPPDWE
jgi:hypothetical protein